MYLGIEIGGTKLQLALGRNDGKFVALHRETVDVAAGAAGIRQQILHAIPLLCAQSNLPTDALRAIGVGFGGPVDDATHSIIKSHQINGWDGFPLVAWLHEHTGIPTFLGNDADLAGFGEAMFGAGQDCSPLLYITIGSGIGGGLIIDGAIARGTGRGAAEIGHLRVRDIFSPTGELATLESIASGWGIAACAQRVIDAEPAGAQGLLAHSAGAAVTAHTVRLAARTGDPLAIRVLQRALSALADGICAAIVLVCPKRVVIGGGVSLMGDELIFDPLRCLVAERVFPPFAGLTTIVPAALGEEVVLHGALAFAARHARVEAPIM